MSLDNHEELQKFIDLSEHYRTYLDEHDHSRPDGRKFHQSRSVQILDSLLQHSYGSSMIRFGNTTVICSITGQLTKPSLKSLRSGFIQTVVLLPRTQAWSTYGRRQQIINENLTLSQHLLDIIYKSKLINLEDLCIEEGKWVWRLQIDFQCLNNDGNLFDSCLFALNIALRHTSFPTVKIDPDTQKPLVYTKELIPFQYNHEQEPLCCTLAIYEYEQEYRFLIDPTVEEENIAKSILHYVLLKNDQICLIHKTSGAPFSIEKFHQCYSLARDYILQLRRKLNQ
ncbi:unnamed protein product [Adineta steineri]|uniref:Ribosomal RNA-processing protein 43 n=1 Tax=Adineta steineri TaxID=433720 RepID=A0A813SY63_9BILA|nr:unnamed protein product [Adineta steineri]CAF0867705.1 unnamed protein product [Adineta steineri]